MPTYGAVIDIQASLERVFAYVADLERHPEWAADPLKVEATAPGPVAVGKAYRSAAETAGRIVTAALRVTDYQPTLRFGFIAQDITGTYQHQFILTPKNGGTHLERHITASLSPRETLLFYAVYLVRKRPYTHAALAKLKAQLETQSS